MNNMRYPLAPVLFSILALNPQALNAATLDQAATPLTDAPVYAKTRESLRPIIKKAMKQNHIVGLSIALIDDQTVVWAEGFGYADKVNKVRATPETVYRTGSISKLFTATAAMQLAEQGKFDIDQPVQTYVPEFSIKSRFPDTGPITPRQLMTHHSGLPSDHFEGDASTAPTGSIAQLIGKLPGEYTAYPPNLMLAYSNLGVTVLGQAVENACGMAFNACLETRLLQPLGMADSEFSTGLSASPLMSKDYGPGPSMPYARGVPEGGLLSSVVDLSKFVRMVLANGQADGRPIIAPATLAEMLRQQNAGVPLDLDEQIGLAWFLGRMPTGEALAGHSGSLGHFNSTLGLLPQRKLGVIVLSNSDGGLDTVDNLSMQALNLMLAEKSGHAAPAQAKSTAPADAPPANLQDFPGYYASALEGLVEIAESNGRLRLVVNGQSFPIALHNDGGVGIPLPSGTSVPLTRTVLSDREVLIMGSPAEGRTLLGEKLAQTALSDSWRKRAGTYRFTSVGGEADRKATGIPATIRLKIKNGFLMVDRISRVFDKGAVLTPVTDSEAVIAGLGRHHGDTVTFETRSGVEFLRYSGFLARRR